MPAYISNFVRIEPDMVVPQEDTLAKLVDGRVRAYKMLNPYFVAPTIFRAFLLVVLPIFLVSLVAVYRAIVTVNYFCFAFSSIAALFFVGLNVWSRFAEGKMRSIMTNALKKAKLGPGVINTRRCFIPEGKEELAKLNTYDAVFDFNKGPHGADNNERTQQYSKIVNKIFRTVYETTPIEEAPANLVHTTCSGYISPSPPQVLVSDKGWNSQTTCSQVYHMGCAASVPSVRTARAFVLDTKKKCDVVHTELLVMHTKPANLNPIQMFFECLFADGAIKYSLTSELPADGHGLEILATHEMIVPNSLKSMSWIVANNGFEMSLSRKVPDELLGSMDVFMADLNARAGITNPDYTKAIFAIHPGGPKIVEGIANHFQLKPHQFHYAWKVLLERGNISSGTLPHIWEQILLDPAVAPGTVIYSIAAAPGLTLAGAVYVKH